MIALATGKPRANRRESTNNQVRGRRRHTEIAVRVDLHILGATFGIDNDIIRQTRITDPTACLDLTVIAHICSGDAAAGTNNGSFAEDHGAGKTRTKGNMSV